MTAKIDIIPARHKLRCAGDKLHGSGKQAEPGAFQAADIYETSVCPLARVMRRELKKRGVKALKVVFSTEPPKISGENNRGEWKTLYAGKYILCACCGRLDIGGGGSKGPDRESITVPRREDACGAILCADADTHLPGTFWHRIRFYRKEERREEKV